MRDQVCSDGYNSNMSVSQERCNKHRVSGWWREKYWSSLLGQQVQSKSTESRCHKHSYNGNFWWGNWCENSLLSLSLSLFPLICLSLSVSFLVSLSVCCSGFVVGNGPSADWYLPFVTAADAKVLEHSGKLQLLLEILHWAEELQDKVWGSHAWIEVVLVISFVLIVIFI